MVQILSHLAYCPTGSIFFDRVVRDGGRFSLSDAPLPTGWTRSTDDDWIFAHPPTALPDQGWKVHVSALPGNAEEVLRICWDHCVDHTVGFKFLRSVEMLFHRSAKYGDRTSSGKFVTIYPPDTEQLQATVTELGRLLKGHAAPTILSDLRWEDGPVHVRYGGFARMETLDAQGEPVLAIRTPDGELVPDVRRPVFQLPDWVTIPDFLQHAIEDRNRGRLRDFPYRPRQALHFSNGGGVYRADTPGGQTVVLKEARPHAGIDPSGADAVVRLNREYRVSCALSELPEVPAVRTLRRGHEHYFLVREDFPGQPLGRLIEERNPLLRGGSDRREWAEYTAWALAVFDRVRGGLAGMHRAGVAYRDLHPGNILIAQDDSIGFIDLEAAGEIDAETDQMMGAPGYMAPPWVSGAAVDLHALGVLAMDLFVPMSSLLAWGPGRAEEILSLIRDRFSVGEEYVVLVRELLAPTTAPARAQAYAVANTTVSGADSVPSGLWAREREGWRPVAERLVGGILAAATPDRDDRLYPGDPAQFATATGGLGLWYGAGGVIRACADLGFDLPDEHVSWWIKRVEAATWTRPGLVDGLAGVSWAMAAVDQDRARELAAAAARMCHDRTPSDLAVGRSGLAAVLVALAESDRDPLLTKALDWAVGSTDWARNPGNRRWGPGLAGGGAGAARWLLELYERVGDPLLLDRAHQAMLADVSDWEATDPGGSAAAALIRSPSLGTGGGATIVLGRLLRHVQDDRLAGLYRQVATRMHAAWSAEAGLARGRAGLRVLASELGASCEDLDRHARELRNYAALCGDRLVVVGRFGLRASCDLATGAAGMALALAAPANWSALFPFPAGPGPVDPQCPAGDPR